MLGQTPVVVQVEVEPRAQDTDEPAQRTDARRRGQVGDDLWSAPGFPDTCPEARIALGEKSFFATLQTELLDRSAWATRAELGQAVFAFVEGFYNPRRRHSTLGYLSPADYETAAGRRHTETAA